MRNSEIEYWALSVIDRAARGQPVEDSRVELKSDLIDAAKAARRIAGHANSSHGETILWLVGVDERRGPCGAKLDAFADWWSQVCSQFDGMVPECTSISITYGESTVLAILFETDRAPYVVRNSAGGHVRFEVPWRDGTAVRSASRSDLLRILVPLQKLPRVELLSGSLTAYEDDKERKWHWNLELWLYAASILSESLVIPFHKCAVSLELRDGLERTSLSELRLAPPYRHGGPPLMVLRSPIPFPRPEPDSLTIDGTATELIIGGPGRFRLLANGFTEPISRDLGSSVARTEASLRAIGPEQGIIVAAEMLWVAPAREGSRNLKGTWACSSEAK
jgi:hypothetical protein